MTVQHKHDEQHGKPESSDFLHLHSLDVRFEIAALWALLLVILIVRFEAFKLLNVGFLGGISGDAGLYVWLFKSHIRDLFSQFWFETNAFYPYAQSLAWSDNFILPGLLGKILTLIGLSDELAYNGIMLVSTYLAGFVTYRILFRLTGSFLPSITAGIAFMTYPYISGMLGHPQLQFTLFIPIACSVLMQFVARRTFFSALLFGLTVTAAFLTTVYYSIFILVLGVVLYLGLSLLRPSWLSIREHLVLFGGFFAGILPILFCLPPYLATAATFGERHLYEAFYFSASALSYLASPPFSLLYSGTSKFSHDEALLFPGFITLLAVFPGFLRLCEATPLRRVAYLFAVLFGLGALFSMLSALVAEDNGTYLRYVTALLSWLSLALFLTLILRMGALEKKLGFLIVTNRALLAIFILLALVSFYISLGPLGNPARGEMAFGIHRLWYEVLPGVDSIRAISRIGVVTTFALSVVLGLVLAHFNASFKLFAKFAVALPFLVVFENFYSTIPVEGVVHSSSVYQLLASKPHANDAVIVLPFAQELNEQRQPASWGEFARRNIKYLLNLHPSGWRTVNGYSGQRSKLMREFPAQLAGFPDKRSITTICTLAGVRYLIFSSEGVKDFNLQEFMQKASLFSSQIQYVDGDLEGNYLFELPCLTKLSENFELLVPSNPGGTIHAELSAPTSHPEASVRLLAMTTVDEQEIPVATIEVSGGTDWQLMSIPLPRTSEQVRPLRIKIKSPADREVLIRDIRYELTDSRPWIVRLFQ